MTLLRTLIIGDWYWPVLVLYASFHLFRRFWLSTSWEDFSWTTTGTFGQSSLVSLFLHLSPPSSFLFHLSELFCPLLFHTVYSKPAAFKAGEISSRQAVIPPDVSSGATKKLLSAFPVWTLASRMCVQQRGLFQVPESCCCAAIFEPAFIGASWADRSVWFPPAGLVYSCLTCLTR